MWHPTLITILDLDFLFYLKIRKIGKFQSGLLWLSARICVGYIVFLGIAFMGLNIQTFTTYLTPNTSPNGIFLVDHSSQKFPLKVDSSSPEFDQFFYEPFDAFFEPELYP